MGSEGERTLFCSSNLQFYGHVCAFFNSPEEEYKVLLPCICDGLNRGERGYHIVPAAYQDGHLERLRNAGVDVVEAQRKRQLELAISQDTYLPGGRFDKDAVLARIQEILQAGKTLGFPLQRLVAHAESVLEDPSNIDEWIQYEARLNHVLASSGDSVICAYDLNLLSAGTALDILRTHPAAIIGGIFSENPFFVPQVTNGLQEAERLGLENRRAAERTRELTAANKQLSNEIHRRARAEEAREELAALVENSTDFIGMASPDGQMLFINLAGRTMVGLARDEDVTGLTLADLMPEWERERLRSEIMPEVSLHGNWKGEAFFRNFQTGAEVPIWQCIFFIPEPGGQRRIALATVSRDLSERRQAEERIREAQAQLAHIARVTSMGELSAAIAHEVNQPLAAVVTNANACLRWLAGDAPDLGEARAAAARIAAEGLRASEVIARIRSLMQKSPARMAALDLNDVILPVLDLIRPQIVRHQIALRTELAPDLPGITGDAIQLQQVLLNLIANAIEAMADRKLGRWEIVLSSQRLPPAGVLVSVRDSGVGIESADLDGLFTPFYTTKEGGMGMGLSISRSIVEAHGGRLWASPNPDRGATFQFSIPARARP